MTEKLKYAFEADLSPDEPHWPRMRFNFANGWSASVVLRMSTSCDAQIATLAAHPTGKWGDGLTELGETEATPDEVARFLFKIARRARYAAHD